MNFNDQNQNNNSYNEQPQSYADFSAVNYPVTVPVLQKPGLTRGGAVLLVVVCIIFSAIMGVGGALLGVQYARRVLPATSTVIYRSVENESVREGGLTVAEVAAVVGESVVEIRAENVSVDPSWSQGYQESGAASGVIISENGYIVTNFHVVDGASHFTVVLKNGDKYDGKLIGTDRVNDIAVLKIDQVGLKPAVWGDSSKIAEGQQVVAIGNPTGRLPGTVTSGVVGATSRTVSVEGLEIMNLIQHSAAVNPGNSGGGLFDLHGFLVGIVNSKTISLEAEGLGFAIPQQVAMKSVETIISEGSIDRDKPALGVTLLQILDDQAASEYGVERLGVYVANVVSGSPAENGGLKVGDFVVSVNGQRVGTNAQISDIVDSLEIGDELEMHIIRTEDNKEDSLTLKIQLGSFNGLHY